jgi:hypothetical protein
MKRFFAVPALALLVSFFCSAQTQTGNASYNESKTGFTISHPSLSFNTRVLVTNLRNNRSVEAVVDYRIPISPDRIADISKDVGDAIGMARTGMTLVEIEELPSRRAASEPPVQAETTPPAPGPQPAQSPAPAPAASSAPAQSPAQPAPSAAQAPPAETIIEEVRYIPVAAAPASCPCTPLLPIFLCLLILVLILLLVILILYLRHLYLWRRYHLIWLRRHYWYIKRRRR